MGWAFVRRRMATELGPDWQAKFQRFDKEASFAASLGQVHRAVAAGRPRRGGEAAISRHGLGARSRPRPAQGRVRHRPALRSRDPHRRDPGRDPHPPARGARLSPRGQARRALSPHAARRAERARAGHGAGAVDRPAADHGLAGRRAAAQLEGARPGGARRARHQHVPRLVRAVLSLRRDPRRPASRQLHRCGRTARST